MTSDPDHASPPLHSFTAHYGAAILALAGALALQSAWPVLFTRKPVESWWPYDACVLTAATAYLLATAWMHTGGTFWLPSELRGRLRELGRGLVSDLVVVAFAVLLYIRAPETSVLRAGMWIVPPVLLAASAASVLVGCLAFWNGVRRNLPSTPPAAATHGKPLRGLLHSVVTLLLLVALIALERFEPGVKPWDVSAPTSSRWSHSTDDNELRR